MVDLLSGWSGWAYFGSGYCSLVYICGDQDREGAFSVSTHKDYGIMANKVFGLYRRNGKSWWDHCRPADDRFMPFENEIVRFDPVDKIPQTLIDHYERCGSGPGHDDCGMRIA